MKVLISIIILINLSFASNANVSLMNNIKSIIQKEEYIALAINKYILQKAKVPKTGASLNWTLLEDDDYLGSDFDKINPLTNENIVVTFDTDNNAYIKSILTNIDDYDNKSKYLYNFYINKIFRVNTIPPKNNTGDELIIGSQVLYNDIQKEIVKVLNETDVDKKRDILFPNQDCTTDITTSVKEYYELKNEKLTLKYCKSDELSFDIYQSGPIYLDKEYEENNLQEIIANIGDIAYTDFGEYIYQSGDDEEKKWVPITKKEEYGEEKYTQEQVQNYIPNASDLVIRKDGGCMLSKGDIYCWGNNAYKKAGVEDENIYLNTPVMLKVDDGNSQYNSSQRVKFIKIGVNSTNVCGISTDGDMYCNGQINSSYFNTDMIGLNNTPILRKNKIFDNIKLVDISMIDDTWALLSEEGSLYTIGSNIKGALGIESLDESLFYVGTDSINPIGIYFKKIYALRDTKTFGALDTENRFWIWGEREPSEIINKPKELDPSIIFDEDRIFVNSKEFTLKGLDGNYYRTNDEDDITDLSISSSALSVSYYEYDGSEYILYIDENMQLQAVPNTLLECKNSDFSDCNTTSNTIFNTALNELNIIKDDKNYAKFSNVSIFSSGPKISSDGSEINSYFDVNGEYLEDFEVVSDYAKVNGKYNDWTVNHTYSSNNSNIPIYTDTTTPTTKFLGKFLYSNRGHLNKDVYKTFKFGSTYAGKTVKISFDFYRIDNWVGAGATLADVLDDLLGALLGGLGNLVGNLLTVILGSGDTTDIFFPMINGNPIDNKGTITESDDDWWWYPYIHKSYDSKLVSYAIKLDKKISGTKKTRDSEYSFTEIEVTLDENGSVELGFGVYMDSYCPFDLCLLGIGTNLRSISDSSWGIDNVKITLVDNDGDSLEDNPYICAMTGVETSTQMYCWGNVARAIPILNTSLYDYNKINSIGDINDLFISKKENEAEQMSYDKYNNNGNLFLKYPTYIGGFDYEFYFK